MKEDSVDDEVKMMLEIFNEVPGKDLSKSSFKTCNFVHNECKKIIDEYIKCKKS
jgi:hypothetical protein